MTAADELREVMTGFGHELDDASVDFVVRLRDDGILTDSDWGQVKQWLREAMEFQAAPDPTAVRQEDGTILIDADADPRNANWLRITAAQRQAGYKMPMWACLWLWWLRADDGPEFWRAVGREAANMGMTPYER